MFEQDLTPEVLGEYIYMGMGTVNGHTVCMSVAYKLDYAIKKALQFERASDSSVIFDSVNKVRVGKLERCARFDRVELTNYFGPTIFN